MHKMNLIMDDVEYDNISRRTIFNFINGKVDMTIGKFHALCELLGCEPMDLMKPMPGEKRRA